MKNLPENFKTRMKSDLPSQYQDFMESYHKASFHGLRVNASKISREDFLRLSPFQLEPIPWDGNGFIYDPMECQPSKDVLYHAGLYYIQEPSAMAPANLLNPKSGDRVLDLCAAPGGKTVEMSSMMRDEGLLVCNDINPKRVRALIRNIEWFGIKNVVIFNEEPKRMAEALGEIFDRVLVDAPCSGEGMFRRDSKAADNWQQYYGGDCFDSQSEILNFGAKMLKSGGRLVYSTCTFGRSENEEIILKFLSLNPSFKLEDIPAEWDISGGLSEERLLPLHGFGRIWPHLHKGEGHFMAKVKRQGTPVPSSEGESRPFENADKISVDAVERFAKENLTQCGDFLSRIAIHENKVFVRPETPLELGRLRYVRNGWFVGEVRKDRFLPSQSLAMGLKRSQAQRTIDFERDDPDVLRYLKGETLGLKREALWHLICVEGFPLGWGKGQGHFIKNFYNRDWRMQG